MKLPISAAVLVWAIQLGVNIVSGNKDMGEEAIETDRRINSKRTKMSHVARDPSSIGVDTKEVKLKPRLEPGHVDESIELRKDEDERNKPNCGVPNRNNRSRIIGGSPVTVHEYPWMVAVNILNDDGSPKLCGGSLISALWVLTAAHCFDDAISVDAVVGPNGDVFTNCQVMIHPEYEMYCDPFWDKNDIALVLLPRLVTFTPICLPQLGDAIRKFNYYGEAVEVLGWGYVSHSNVTTSPVLKQAKLTIKPDAMCYCLILDSQICMENRRQGVSFGDSGGPAQHFGPNSRYALLGVLSHMSGDCNQDAVFTQTSSFLTWISRTTGKRIT